MLHRNIRRHPDAAKLWGERVRIAQEKGMDALVDGTLARWFTEPYRKAQPEVMAREIQANLPGSELKVIPSAAHLSNIEQPQAFNDALTAFYQRVVH